MTDCVRARARVHETCVCGGEFEDSSTYEPYVNQRLEGWRDRHQVCREAWAEATKTPAAKAGLDQEEKSEGLAERLEGTEPLTDEEIRAVLGATQVVGDDVLFPAPWADAVRSARAKLRARLARDEDENH